MLDAEGFMTTDEIITAIDGQIVRLLEAKELLTNLHLPVRRGPGRPAGTAHKKDSSLQVKVADKSKKSSTMSAEGRARVAAAQKARWAKSKRDAKDDALICFARLAKSQLP